MPASRRQIGRTSGFRLVSPEISSKGDPMNTKLCRIVALWSLSITLAAPLFAQYTDTLSVNIPFEFVVGKQTLPAGDYTVLPSGLALRIQNSRTKKTMWVLTTYLPESMPSRNVNLEFHRYGEIYFLSRVRRPDAGFGFQLRESPIERELARRAPAPRIESVIAAK
jgi:hypothetical protein